MLHLWGVDRRLDGMDRRLDSFEHRTALRFDQVERRFNWLTGIVVGTWITTMLAVIFHH
jgi:tetrahydromethanopterin S-methyltransferase subunit G